MSLPLVKNLMSMLRPLPCRREEGGLSLGRPSSPGFLAMEPPARPSVEGTVCRQASSLESADVCIS